MTELDAEAVTADSIDQAMQAGWVEIDPQAWLTALHDYAPQAQLDNLAEKYRALPAAVWEQYGAWTEIPMLVYDLPWQVCWSYAIETLSELVRDFAVNGCAVVLDYPSQHAYNLLAVTDDDDGVVARMWEPQTGTWVPDDKIGSDPYSLGRGAVVIA